MLDALQQRLSKYREASIQARASGDERKARMHERIAKVGPWPHSPLPSSGLFPWPGVLCLLLLLLALVFSESFSLEHLLP